jgi:RNA polymerase sigma-70 factor (ECF subfamily)
VTAERTQRAPQRSPQRSNEQWLADLRSSGGPRAEAALADLHALVAAAVRAAIGGSRADEGRLEDLTQVAEVRVLRQLARFEGRSRFTTWVYAVAARAALSELRRSAYRRTAEPLPSEDKEPASAVVLPSTHAARNEIVALIQRVIEHELTERQRAALLGELDGQPRAELAARLGTNPNALAKLLFDAREKLVVGLRTAGITDEEVREVFEL